MKMAVVWDGVIWQILTDVSAVIMEAVITSETSVNIYRTTQRNISEDNHLQV
jgi:hypothetical protein